MRERVPGPGHRHATIDAIRRGLGTGPLVYRYSGAREEREGAFVACSFWTVSALHHVDRSDEAREGLTNDVGIDPADNAFLGNLPQGLSHLALIGAALDLKGRSVSPDAADTSVASSRGDRDTVWRRSVALQHRDRSRDSSSGRHKLIDEHA
jgi:hypothetical protein